jgi:glycosyltransferase involved in cell wall biosynthesis
MKILMLSDLYPPFLGGIETHTQSLSKGLSQRGHEVIVCTTGWRDLPRYEEENSVRIYRLEGLFQRIPFLFKDPARRWHPPALDWLISKRLAQIIERNRPDIIHAHGWIVYSVLPLKKDFKIPLVYTIHDYRLFCPKMLLVKGDAICDHPSIRTCIPCIHHDYGLLRALSAYCGVRVNRTKLRYVDTFIAVSAFVKEAYEEHLGMSDKEIVTIPNFCDPGVNSKQKKVKDFPDDFILFVGWLMPHKGVDVLIKAYQELNTKTKLLIIGIEHPDYCYQSTENIRLIKNAPHHEVMEAMSKCRFAIFPSICPDCSPIVAREAMSQRKTIIASNIGGLKETVVDGGTGILVPPNNVDKLADAISYLLEKPEVASIMGENGYRRFMENYTPSVVIPRIMDVYESLIKSSGV